MGDSPEEGRPGEEGSPEGGIYCREKLDRNGIVVVGWRKEIDVRWSRKPIQMTGKWYSRAIGPKNNLDHPIATAEPEINM